MLTTINDAANFCRQLATILDSGVPVSRGLKLLEQQAGVDCGARILQLRRLVDDGTPLHRAVLSLPEIFSPDDADILRIAESCGRVDFALRKLGDVKGKWRQRSRRVAAKSLYPVLIYHVAVGIAATVTFVFDGPVEAGLRCAAGLAPFYLAACVLTAARHVARLYPGVNRMLQRAIYFMPCAHGVVVKLGLARYWWSLQILADVGAGGAKAATIAAAASGNAVLRQKFDTVADAIRSGDSFASGLERLSFVSAATVEMIAAGEECGRLPDMLEKVAAAADADAERALINIEKWIPQLVYGLVMIWIAALICDIAALRSM